MLIMGSGNTKNGQRKDEKIAGNDEERVKPRQQDDKLNNKPPHNQEKNQNLSKNNDSTRKKPKDNEEKTSSDSDDEETQPVEDIKLKLSERGFSDTTLILHCEKTPKYFEYFTSMYEAIKSIEERIKDEDILSIQRQATVISSSYSKVKRKTALGNFLAEIGFAKIFKEIYLKLDSGFPELLTYDRELDENLKKPSAVGNESSKDTDNKQVINPSTKTSESIYNDKTTECNPNISSNQPTDSATAKDHDNGKNDKTTESNPNISNNQPSDTSCVSTAKDNDNNDKTTESNCNISSNKPSDTGVSAAKDHDNGNNDKTTESNPNISSKQPSDTSVSTPEKLNVKPTDASVNNVTANNEVEAPGHETNAKPAQVVEGSSAVSGTKEQPSESLHDKQPNEQTKDCLQHAKSGDQPLESNRDKPSNDELEKLGGQTIVPSVQPADLSKQPEKNTDTENTDKPTDVQEKKPKPSNPLLKAQDLLSKIMLSAINYTDACDNMNLAFSEEGVVQLLVNAVAKLKDCTGHHIKYMNEEGGLKKRTARGGIFTKVLGTLHNLSKRVPTRPNFHICNAVKIILPLIDDEVNRFAIDALLIIAYLIDEENNNLIMASEGPIKYLISMISKATKKSIHRYLGYTNSELAQGLAQIAINDSNKKKIVSCGAIPVLTHMIEAAKIENEKVTAAEALWMLAFDQENREEMKKDEKCMRLLNHLRESKIDKTKKAASGALWEIEGKQNMVTGLSTDAKSSASTTNHVMISYQWDVQNTLIQVKDRLQAAGYRVWMDLEQMGGSTLEAMAKAVENSAVVLICVSQKYKESSNCRSEAEYAFQLRKDIIPLMMDRNYRPDGWLGMIMGSKLWIDFSLTHISKVESGVTDLIKELGVRGKGDSEIVTVRSVDVVDAKPAIDISGWTNDDVMNWMKGFGLVIKNKIAAENLTGSILTRLHTFRNEVSPEFYYSSLKEDFGFPRMIDVLIFSDELKKLLS